MIYNGVAGPPRALAAFAHRSAARRLHRPHRAGKRTARIRRRGQHASTARFRSAASRSTERRYSATPTAARYAAQVRADAEGLPLEFAGWVDDIYACMAQLDLLLVPSAGHEATTRVILEAFAAGIPVIAFPSGGIPEVVEDGVTGLLANTAEEMARRAIELLTGDPCRLLSIAQAAHKSWEQRFTLDRYHRQILRAIGTSCQEKANRATDEHG